MRFTRFAWTALLSLVPLSLAIAKTHGLNFTSNVDSDAIRIGCEDIKLKFWDEDRDDIQTARRSEIVTLRADGGTPFRIEASEQGGVRVQPSEDGSFTAEICLAAGARSSEACQRILEQLTIVNNRGDLTVTGPEDEAWAAEIIVSAPEGTKIDMSAGNGALRVKGVSGNFRMRTINGPITVKNAGGEVDAETQNGPIAFSGHSGDVRLESSNGPVSVRIDEPSWKGKGLEARTQNGPVSLRTPDNLKSAVEVEGSWYSPTTYNGTSLPMSDREGGKRSIRLGDGPTLVRLSTVNGPVSVKSRAEAKPTKSKKEIKI